MNRLFYFTGIADNKNQAIKIFFYHLRCKHFRESYGFYIDKSNYDNASQWIKHIREAFESWYFTYKKYENDIAR